MTRKVIGLIGLAGVLFGLGAIPASADDNGYNPPPAVQGKCDAGHGAFGAFSHHFEFSPAGEFPAGTNWIAADAKEDGGLGHDTGPTNSGFSQFCKTQ